MGPGGAAGHRRRVDEPERVRVDRDLRGQRVQGLVQQRPGSVDPLAVAGLLGQVGEHPTQAAVAETQPARLRGAIQHHLRHGQADQLRVGEPLGPSWPTTFGRQNLVIDEHVQCGQEGVEVSSHERPSTPSNPFRSSRHAEGFGIDRLVVRRPHTSTGSRSPAAQRPQRCWRSADAGAFAAMGFRGVLHEYVHVAIFDGGCRPGYLVQHVRAPGDSASFRCRGGAGGLGRRVPRVGDSRDGAWFDRYR